MAVRGKHGLRVVRWLKKEEKAINLMYVYAVRNAWHYVVCTAVI